jgi:hypothetical protein
VWASNRAPAPNPAAAPTEFSAARALDHLHAIARRPHPSTSEEHARVREYVISTLSGLSVDNQLQDTTGVGTHNPVAAHVINVIARVPGTSPGAAVLLTSHYDGVPAGPAAADDGAGVAALLETVRALRAGPRLRHDVIVLFSDGEESGLTGAAAFVREHAWARDVAVILNFDARGTHGPAFMFETGAGNRDVVHELRRVRSANASSLASTIYRLLPNDTDLSELLVLGQPAMNFAFVGGVERYHTSEDDVEHLDMGSVQDFGVHALTLARGFGDGELPRPRTGDAVFFTVPVVGIVMYPEWAAMPSAVGAAAIVLSACVRLRRHQPRWLRDMLLGFLGIIVSIGLAIGLAIGAVRLLGRWSALATFGRPALLSAGAILLFGLAASDICWTLVRKWATAVSARTGALIAAAALALIVTALLPGASYLFVWPLVAAAGALLLSISNAQVRIVLASEWIAAVIVAAVIAPIVYSIAIVGLGMDVPSAVILSMFTGLSLWLVAPQLESLVGLRKVLAFVGMALVFLVLSGFTARAAPGPVPSMFGYAFDADSSRAWLIAPFQFARARSWAAKTIGPAARLIAPAARIDDPSTAWLTRAMAGDTATLAAPAALESVGAPQVSLRSDSAAGTERRLDLLIRPAAGTYSIRLRVLDAAILSSQVDGRPIDERRYRSQSTQWTLGYVAPSADGFSLRLVVRRQSAVTLEVIARSLGLPPAVAEKIGPRPPGVLPIHSGDQTIVHRTIRF